jgi:hypothetical protein
MDLVSAFLSIQESDLDKGAHKISGVAGPVRGDFEILAAHSLKIAFRAVLGDP